MNNLLILSLLALGACGPKEDRSRDGASHDAARSDRSTRILDHENAPAVPNSEIINLPDLLGQIGISRLHEQGFDGSGKTIAIFDNGYLGLDGALGHELPPGLAVEHAPEPGEAETSHGTLMAKIVYAVATGSARYLAGKPGPNLILYNTNGLTNLRAATQDVIRRRVDMVLYAQIWEFGGTPNFVNAMVQEATAAGILWINASGNYGKASYSGPIRIKPDGNVYLPHLERYVRFMVKDHLERVKVSLAWNDFRFDESYRTNQDLDFSLETSTGALIKSQSWRQDGKSSSKDVEGFTAHAREYMHVELIPGEYRVHVKAASRNFHAGSQMWLSANGPGIEFLDQGLGDSVYVPANDDTVIAVGAYDVDFSSARADGSKPDLTSPSLMKFSDGQAYAGTSVASALTTGAIAVFLDSSPNQTHDYRSVQTLIQTQQITTLVNGQQRLNL